MRKLVVMLLILVALLTLAGCGGVVQGVEKDYGESEIYSTAEINSAMNVVISHFKRNFNDCILQKLWYDEKRSFAEAQQLAQRYGVRDVIILYSDYYVSPGGGDGSLNTNYTYTNWNWILVRDGLGWKLQDWGY